MDRTDGLPINVTVHTHVTDRDEKKQFIMETEGKFYSKKTSCFLQFKEPEQVEVGTVTQIVKIEQEDTVSVIRQGSISMKQTFTSGKKTEGVYRSMFGPMLMDTATEKVRVSLDEKNGSGVIELLYQLHMQQEFAGDYQVTIEFRRKEDEHC